MTALLIVLTVVAVLLVLGALVEIVASRRSSAPSPVRFRHHDQDSAGIDHDDAGGGGGA